MHSPNFDSRKGVSPTILLLHYTGMENEAAALQRLCDPAAKVSSHYFIRYSGEILQLVEDQHRAWHAGAGAWQGLTDINSHSIGIEIANKGHEYGYEDFAPAQIESVIALAKKLNLPQILAHSDIAPSRKQDPGEKFPWHILAAQGLGQYVTPAPLEEGATYKLGDEGPPIQALQLLFARLGYGLPLTGVYDMATQEVVTAFQRHWRQEKVDGVADVSTIKTLRGLLAKTLPSPSGEG